MRRTASTGIAALVLLVAGCRGAAYQPYNGPSQPAAAKEPSPGMQESAAPKQATAPQPAPEPPRLPVPKHVRTSIQLTSRSFGNGGPIPSSFTCDGFDDSPDLAWSGIPPGTVELAVTMEDPKAAHGRFMHWALFGLKPSLTGLAAGEVPPGARQGMNDFHQTGYGGPCPAYTDSTHHYVITLYALNAEVPLTDGAPASDVRDQVESSALAKGRLTSTYHRRA